MPYAAEWFPVDDDRGVECVLEYSMTPGYHATHIDPACGGPEAQALEIDGEPVDDMGDHDEIVQRLLAIALEQEQDKNVDFSEAISESRRWDTILSRL